MPYSRRSGRTLIPHQVRVAQVGITPPVFICPVSATQVLTELHGELFIIITLASRHHRHTRTPVEATVMCVEPRCSPVCSACAYLEHAYVVYTCECMCVYVHVCV